ncbi:kunitz-type serine protease inhibitor bitisilin-1-like [Diabrotica virgifera virgifera]|uniref:BPTI/Kunitz inhibitor domain-containing protein n=1 Tax=Diabrotica virgifera virgifera TaxID=50390 RepID=A0ABM5IAL8_DIAVI|nr:kunitz-type serine protease inhibitor bitisilin-1-like [Diabrotica virgifera virgifera]
MKTTALFFCFCIIAISQVFGDEDLPDIKVQNEDPEAQAARSFRKEDCNLGVETGFRCRARKPVYRWSNEDNKCVKDYYGGCHATKNNFRSKDDCVKTATPVCSS